MAKIRNIKRKNIYNPTDLRVVLSGVASWSVSANISQTITLTNLWLSRSENTVIKVYLPAWLTFVSSPNGVHSGGVITWTRGTVKDAFTDTFVVTSVIDDDYEIVATVETTTYDTDPDNSRDTKILSVEDAWYAVEIRGDNILFSSGLWPQAITAFEWSVSGDLMWSFIEDIEYISGTVYRLWYLSTPIPAQGITILNWEYWPPFAWSTFYRIFTPPYNGTDPITTVNLEWEV